MSASTLTSKGQITIPRDVRRSLHLHPGDKLDFSIEGNGDVRISPVTKRVADVFGCLSRKASRKSVSVEKMNESIAKTLRKKWK